MLYCRSISKFINKSLIKKIFYTVIINLITIVNIYSFPLETYYAQSANIQELETTINDPDSNDKSKLEALTQISIYYALNQPSRTALKYINSTVALAKKMNNTKTVIQSYLLYAKVYIEENKIHKAYSEIDNALNIATYNQYNNLIGQSLVMMAYFYKRLGFFGYSLEYCLKAVEYMSDLNIHGKFYLYIELGDVYLNLSEYKHALNTFFTSYEISKNNNIPNLTALSIAKIAAVYIALEEYNKAIAYLDKAFEMVNGNTNSDFIKILIISNLAEAYSAQGHLTLALKKLEHVLKLCKKQNFKFLVSKTLLEIANIYLKQKKYDESKQYLEECRAICLKSPTLYEIQLKLHDAYCKYYAATGKYKQALKNKNKSDLIRHKLYYDKIANRIAILEAKFRHEQSIKSNELLKKSIALKEEKIKSDQRFILFLIIITILILLLTTLFIVLYYNKRKYITRLNNMNKELEVTVQKRTSSLKRTVDNLRSEIKERKKLQKLVEKISDREQRRIGHDIHDSLGQILVGISFASQALSRKLKKIGQEQLSKEATNIVNSASQACTQARDLAKLLAPVELKEEGLNNALERLAAFIKTNYNIQCNISIKRERNTELASQLSTNIYRIIQEATNNAAKHSNATKIDISLDLTRKPAILNVKDNGKGLPIKDKDNYTGMGLKIMETRSELMHGRLLISSTPDKGTQIQCRFPLKYKQLI